MKYLHGVLYSREAFGTRILLNIELLAYILCDQKN
jgi:hypothetical protein